MRHDRWMATKGTPPVLKPMLATLGKMPTGSRWAFEFKWDGVRAIVSIDGDQVHAMSRNDIDVTPSYPELLEVPAQLGRKRRLVLDGELVTLDKRGAPSFGLLQQRMHVKRPEEGLLSRYQVRFYVFDLLWLDGESLLGWPYHKRRDALEKLKPRKGTMSVTPRFPGPGEDLLEAAKANGLEGVVAKALESTYEPGRRSLGWIKVPLNQTQEVIVVGWKPGAGRREGLIGSLLLAAYGKSGKLEFIGHVGTGFTDSALRSLAKEVAPLKRATSPVDGAEVPREHARSANWLKPTLVGEVEFRNWTPEGRLRHPSWRGLRWDKTAKDVTFDLPS
jgi:bifunctional non-homologous end joining protein LigD